MGIEEVLAYKQIKDVLERSICCKFVKMFHKYSNTKSLKSEEAGEEDAINSCQISSTIVSLKDRQTLERERERDGNPRSKFDRLSRSQTVSMFTRKDMVALFL